MHHVLWRKTVRGSARGSRSRERIFLCKPWTEIETPTPSYPEGIPIRSRVESRSLLHDAQRNPHALGFPPSPSVRLRGQSRPDRGPCSARLWHFRLFEMTVGGWQGRAEPRGPSVSVVCPVSERHRGARGQTGRGRGVLACCHRASVQFNTNVDEHARTWTAPLSAKEALERRFRASGGRGKTQREGPKPIGSATQGRVGPVSTPRRPRVCIIARCTNLHVLAWAA
eukprot:scaffold287_cov337-Pavlova_lutheri.AAC.191